MSRSIRIRERMYEGIGYLEAGTSRIFVMQAHRDHDSPLPIEQAGLAEFFVAERVADHADASGLGNSIGVHWQTVVPVHEPPATKRLTAL